MVAMQRRPHLGAVLRLWSKMWERFIETDEGGFLRHTPVEMQVRETNTIITPNSFTLNTMVVDVFAAGSFPH